MEFSPGKGGLGRLAKNSKLKLFTLIASDPKRPKSKHALTPLTRIRQRGHLTGRTYKGGVEPLFSALPAFDVNLTSCLALALGLSVQGSL